MEATLWMALCRRHHGEETSGIQAYQTVLAQFHIQVNLSGKGDCYDNTMMESFIRSLKTE